MRTKMVLWAFSSTHPKMPWIQSQIKEKDGPFTFSPGISPPLSSSSSSSSYSSSSNYQNESTPSSSASKISPAVLFVIVVLAVIFFISGLLHLLVRFLVKKPSSSSTSPNRYPEMSGTDALQRQLQQLFHLHDSGLDQAFIDALPVFLYKEMMGQKEPFDCAVCLSEFSEQDKLRLLPICSHAFHINCIDTWLLSNSTCPLCRGTLFTSDLSIENPVFEFDDTRGEDGFPSDREDRFTCGQKTGEIDEIVGEKRVLPVRLGKFRNMNDGVQEVTEEREEGESSSRNLDARRCYSMGSYQYVVGDSNLQVALRHDRDAGDLKLMKGRRDNGNSSVVVDMEGKKLSSRSKGESFSVSKIWLWSKKGKFPSPSDSQMGIPSSLNIGLPWPERTQGV